MIQHTSGRVGVWPISCVILTIISVFLIQTTFSQAGRVRAGGLESYVNEEDNAYDWKVEETKDIPGAGTAYHGKLTSQEWRDKTWTHNTWTVFPGEKPEEETERPGLVIVAGGDGGWTMMNLAGQVASSTGYVITVLNNVPNQPFFDDLKEDALIAHTFEKYLDTGDQTWPLLLPMTKSAVRAMDTVSKLGQKKENTKITEFVVGGASKRGWTSWLTAAIDDRVSGLIPMVFDNLRFRKQLKNQKRVWKSFSEKIKDYTSRNLHKRLDSKRGKKLLKMVDPYSYRESYDMPTLIFSGTNDGYWPVNSINLFYSKLRQEKYLYYGPNAGHEMGTNYLRILSTLKAFLLRIKGELQFPSFSSRLRTVKEGKKLTFSVKNKSDHTPTRILLWRADSKDGDFRPSKWKSTTIGEDTKKAKHLIETGATSFIGLFGQIFYNIDGQKFSLSTKLHRKELETD